MNCDKWNSGFPATPEHFHSKLCRTLAQLPEKEQMMKNRKMTLQRTLLFAAIAALVLATTAFAVGNLSRTVSHSDQKDAFTQMPTATQMEKTIKATPKAIEQFDNGFAFTQGVVVNAQDMDESGAALSKYQMLELTYSSGTKTVTLTMEKQQSGRAAPPNSTELLYQNVPIIAYEHLMKTVPLDYVKTEQDLKDEAIGKVVIGTMGGDTIETDVVRMVLWTDGEVSYYLYSSGEAVSIDEMVAMAQQMIDQ